MIFCTAYPQHAAESYEVEALDYLVKPVAFERFLAAVNKLRKFNSGVSVESDPVAVGVNDQIFIKSGAQIHQVDIRDISYLRKDLTEDLVLAHLLALL